MVRTRNAGEKVIIERMWEWAETECSMPYCMSVSHTTLRGYLATLPFWIGQPVVGDLHLQMALKMLDAITKTR